MYLGVFLLLLLFCIRMCRCRPGKNVVLHFVFILYLGSTCCPPCKWSQLYQTYPTSASIDLRGSSQISSSFEAEDSFKIAQNLQRILLRNGIFPSSLTWFFFFLKKDVHLLQSMEPPGSLGLCSYKIIHFYHSNSYNGLLKF